MSVLNTMLQDLERRGARPIQPLPALDRPDSDRSLPILMATDNTRGRTRVLAAMLLLTAAAAGAAWIWMRSAPWNTPQPVQAPPVAARPVPAIVADSGATAPAAPAVQADSGTKVSEAPATRSIAPAAAPSPAAIVEAAPAPMPPEHPHTPTPAAVATSTPVRAPKAVPAAGAAPAQAAPVKPVAANAGAPAMSPPVSSVSPINLAQSDLAHATELISRGRSSDAEALLNNALQQQPTLHDARLALAAVQADRGQRRQALVTLLDGVNLDPARFALTAAQLQAELDDPQGALQTLERVAPAARGDAYHALAAAIAQRAGQHEQAVTEYGQALKSNPGNALAWVGMGVSLQALRRDARALEAYRNAAQGSLSADLRRFVKERVDSLQGVAAAQGSSPRAAAPAPAP